MKKSNTFSVHPESVEITQIINISPCTISVKLLIYNLNIC